MAATSSCGRYRFPTTFANLGSDFGTTPPQLGFVALLAAMLLGAGTDYAIFLIGLYREGRRRSIEWRTSLVKAYRGVAPVITRSALTIAGALTCLSMAHLCAAIAHRPSRPLVLMANADGDSGSRT